MNRSQASGMRRLAERYFIQLPTGDLRTSLAKDATVDWDKEFSRTESPDDEHSLMVEIGSGTGEALLARAQANPMARLIAFEVYEAAVASTLLKLEAANIGNVRILMVDGVQGLRQLFSPGSIDEICVYFPDPWHKKRHHKRRLINPEFAALVASRLAPGGVWRMATDWPDYANQMLKVASNTPGLGNEHPDWAPRPPSRPLTRFEKRGITAGRPVRDLTFQRIP